MTVVNPRLTRALRLKDLTVWLVAAGSGSGAGGGLVAQWWSAQGGAEQVADAVGDGEAECAADQDAEDRAAGVAGADAGTERPGEGQGDQDRDDGDGYSPTGGWEQNRHQW
jgi:hypothetical protein